MGVRWQYSAFACTFAAMLSACSGGGSPIPNAPGSAGSGGGHTFNVGPYVGRFTEYALPAGQAGPGGITVGPDGAVWFTVNSGGIDRIIQTGAIKPFTSPQIGDVFLAIASADNALWYAANSPPLPQMPTGYLVRQGTSGPPTLEDFLPGGDADTGDMVGAADGNLWATFDNGVVSGVVSYDATGHQRVTVELPFNYTAEGVAAGSDGNIYVTGFGDLATPDSAVFQISNQGTILHQLNLPNGSHPNGIVAGADGALWIALDGSNSIGRLTTTGNLTQFPIPTADAQPARITKDSAGTLWFTEPGANAIARMTTSGTVNEYPVPTANAHPFGITTCPEQCANAHGRLWFTESSAAKVGKFEY